MHLELGWPSGSCTQTAAYSRNNPRPSITLRREPSPLDESRPDPALKWRLHVSASRPCHFRHHYTAVDAPASIADAIRIRSVRRQTFRLLSLDIPLKRPDGGDRRVGLRQVLAGVRHAVRRRASGATSRPSRPTRASSSTAWTSRRWRMAGMPPAIAIDQTNPVRTSRSTVGDDRARTTIFKLLYARMGTPCCRGCGNRCAATAGQHRR